MHTDVYLSQPEIRVSISKFMSYVHLSVNEMSKTYLTNERRYNYTTPKSFLELVRDLETLQNSACKFVITLD